MGQYFKPVNVDRQEFVDLPGPKKATERITNVVAMGMFSYLFLEGPLDGTSFAYGIDPDDPQFHNDIENRIGELEQLEEGATTRSIYQNYDGSWNRYRIAISVAANREISDIQEYAGRWAGDRVYLVGDYSETGMYDQSRDKCRYRRRDTGEEFETTRQPTGPVIPEPLERDMITHTTEARDPVPGDLCYVIPPGEDDHVYATLLETGLGEWTNITPGLTEEFVDFVDESWVEQHTDVDRIMPEVES